MWRGSHAPLPRLSDANALSTTSRAPLTPAVVRTPKSLKTLLCSYKKNGQFQRISALEPALMALGLQVFYCKWTGQRELKFGVFT